MYAALPFFFRSIITSRSPCEDLLDSTWTAPAKSLSTFRRSPAESQLVQQRTDRRGLPDRSAKARLSNAGGTSGCFASPAECARLRGHRLLELRSLRPA